jgi:uncharacterized protein YndB with AHSA1/START domain
MHKQLVAKASITIDAPVAKVWEALTNPEMIKQYMFGTNVTRAGARAFRKELGNDAGELEKVIGELTI